ncbi:Uncharacterised protein [Mycobacteroides abscessus subsp. abscessus]|nr:Uncharacterised protein [Mycobacteroides abscessus subsp. abscessus]
MRKDSSRTSHFEIFQKMEPNQYQVRLTLKS